MAILWTNPNYTNYHADGTQTFTPKPTFDGAVLGSGQKTVQLMSDVWATGTFARVWNGTAIVEVSVGNDEFGHDGKIVVDATPDVLAAAAAFTAAKAAEAEADRKADIAYRIALEAKRPALRRTAKVVKGRKVAIGTTGRIFWIGNTGYGQRVGLELASGERVFTAATNVEAIADAVTA